MQASLLIALVSSASKYEQEPVYEQLFDLRSDLLQLTNLAADPAFEQILGTQRERCDELLGR